METSSQNHWSDMIDYLLPADPRTADWFMVKNVTVVHVIVALYLYLVKGFGPRFMKNRQPFECTQAMIIYNFIQMSWNGYMAVQGFWLMTLPTFTLMCGTIEKSDHPYSDKILSLMYLYYMNKIADGVDTVFMVLQKKNKQITHLHVYHHSVTMLGAWVMNKYIPGGAAVFLVCVNSFVNCVMYAYYLLTSLFPLNRDSLWWKRHITEMQLIQFGMIAFVALVHLLNPTCTIPRILLLFTISYDLYVTYMFWGFYKKSYLIKNENSEKYRKDKFQVIFSTLSEL